MKIGLHIQSLANINREVMASNMHQCFHIGRHTNHEILLITPNRGSIDRGRNEAARIALEAEYDYLWFLDDDMLILPHTLDSLISCDADIVMALSYIRGYPYQPMCFFWTEGSGPQNLQGSSLRGAKDEDLENGDAVVDVAAVGFTCTLIKTSLLKKLQPPYFLTSANCTEDVHFCLKAHFEQSSPVIINVDTRVPTIHLGDPEHITKETVVALREYHKKYHPPEKKEDRGDEYLESVENALLESEG